MSIDIEKEIKATISILEDLLREKRIEAEMVDSISHPALSGAIHKTIGYYEGRIESLQDVLKMIRYNKVDML